MSGPAMTAAYAGKYPSLSVQAVAVAMAKLAQDEGRPEFWGAVATLCEMTGLSRRTVQRAIQWLKKAGFIIAAGIHRTYRTARYLLAFAMGQAPAPAPEWHGTRANLAPHPCQNGTQLQNLNKTEIEREGRECTRAREAPLPLFFEKDFQRKDEAAEPCPTATVRDPAPPESQVLESGSATDLPGNDLAAWWPNAAEIRLAEQNGAVDVEAERRVFLRYHERQRTPFADLSKRWPGFCERIATYGPNGTSRRRSAGPDPAPVDIDESGIIIDIPCCALTLAGQADPVADAAIRRIDGIWPGQLSPIQRAELRDAFVRGGYPEAVLHAAIKARLAVRFPKITIGDFVSRADELMEALQAAALLRPDPETESEAREAESRAAAERETREAREREAAACKSTLAAAAENSIMLTLGIPEADRDRFRAIVELHLLAWPAGGYGRYLLSVQACDVTRLALTDPDAARAHLVQCLSARRPGGTGAEPDHLRVSTCARPEDELRSVARQFLELK